MLGGLLAILLEVATAAVALLLFAILASMLRRWHLGRAGAIFDCSLRVDRGVAGRGWRSGLARYEPEGLAWYRMLSLSLRPRAVLSRRDLEITRRRAPASVGESLLLAGPEVVVVRDGDQVVELAMSEGALTGLLAWLEAAAPPPPSWG